MGRKVEPDLAKYLEGKIPWLLRQSTASAQGKKATLFLGELPPVSSTVPLEAASISEYPGEGPLRVFSGKKIEKPRVIITVRAQRYNVAQDYSYAIHDALDGITDTVIDGTLHVWIGAVSLPSEGTPDAQNNAIFNGNYMVWREVNVNA